jgi:hypothetical protein
MTDLEDKWYREPEPSRLRGPLLALVPLVAIVAIAVAVIQIENGATAVPSLSPGLSPGSTNFDPMHLVTGADTYSIALEGRDLVIEDSLGGQTIELGRLQVSVDASASPPTVAGGVSAVMQCPSGATRLFFFGHLSLLGRGLVASYVGPTADGGIAPDGLFLFLIAPGARRSERLEIDVNGQPRLSIGVAIGNVGDPGVTKQPSGCIVGD